MKKKKKTRIVWDYSASSSWMTGGTPAEKPTGASSMRPLAKLLVERIRRKLAEQESAGEVPVE